VTLLDDLVRAADLAHDADDFELRDRFAEHARRLREEMAIAERRHREDSSFATLYTINAIERLNGGPVSREPG